MKRAFISIIVFTVFLFMGIAKAQDNKINPGKIDLMVYVNYDEQDLNSWHAVFEEFSKMLYNATEKQLQIGKVYVSKCGFSKEKADVWILDGDGCAFSPVLGFGVPNEHMTIYESHKSLSDTLYGPFALLQAFAHYGFGLYDEHRGKVNGTGPWVEDDRFFCVTNTDPVVSVMDGGARTPIKNHRFEFCTDSALGWSTSHNYGYTDAQGNVIQTAQQLLNEEDSWSTIVRNTNLQYPAAEPTDDISGYEPIEFIVIDPVSRLVTCIDRSGSMYGEKIRLAKVGAKIFVDLAHFGEYLAVTSYASSGSVDYPMQELVTQQDKEDAKAAIDGLVASGATSIGAGLRTSLNEITGNGSNPVGCTEVIALLSDGRHNTGESPYDVLPDLIERGVKVYTIGLGNDVDADLMSDIAFQTGGTYHFAQTEQDLAQIFTIIYAKARSEDLYASVSGQVNPGETQTTTTYVDGFTREITFELNYPSGSELDLSLVSPSGQVIDTNAASGNVEFVKGTAHKYFRIVQPEVGDWQVVVSGNSISSETPYSMIAFGNSRDVSTFAGPVKSSFTYPEPVIIRASVVAGEPVVNATVTGIVTRPDNSTTTIQLYDDGNAAHGDDVAGDGIYSTIFNDFAGAGSGNYSFKITIENRNGSEPAKGQLPFVEEGCGFTPQSVPEFVRVEEFSTVINNVPEVYVMKEFNIDFARLVFNQEPRVFVQGNFTIHDNSNGFDPVNEEVTFQVGNFVTVIPPNSFKIVDSYRNFKLGLKDTTIYLYQSADGKENMYIVTVNGVNGLFGYAGVGMDLSSTYALGPQGLPFQLQIGDDRGNTTVDMTKNWPGRWVYGKRIRLVDVQRSENPGTANTVPVQFELSQNYPNPFNPGTEIPFALPERAQVTLQIFDLNGRLVTTLVNGTLDAGYHRVTWNGKDQGGNNVSSGIYIYQLKITAEDGSVRTFHRKMTLLR